MECDVIALGKRIIDQLSIDESNDVLDRWMAHYLAEQMLVVQSSTGKAKEAAQQRCSELIVKIWEHKMLPNNKTIQSMMQTLQKLNSQSYFILEHDFDEEQAAAFSSFPQSTLDWLQLATSIDAIARIWVNRALEEASKEATITDFPGLSELLDAMGNDITRIVRSFVVIDDDAASQQRAISLENYISALDNFVTLSSKLRALFAQELVEVKQGMLTGAHMDQP